MSEMKKENWMLLCAVLALALGVAGLVWALAGPGERAEPEVPSPAVRVTEEPGPTAAPEGSEAPDDSAAPDSSEDRVAPRVPEATPAPTPAVGAVVGPEYDYAQAVPESEPVEEAYFADAVFIGDSRTDGFRIFSGLTQGDYLVKTGLSVFKVEKDQVKVEGQKMTVAEALARKRYGKVYVCLGLNELGMGDDQGYYDHYAAFLDTIRAIQPEAVVYVQLLIPVNEQKCAEKGTADYVNNAQIAVYNGLLRQLAQDKRVFLTDPAQAIVDPATGQPPYDAVADGVHFQKEPYQQWLEYLKRHTVVPPEAGPEEGPAEQPVMEEEIA